MGLTELVVAASRYTLAQVAEALSLPESAVLRLSRLFELPRRYFRPVGKAPRLMIFGDDELEILKTVQQLIIAGKSIAEIKSYIEPVVLSRQVPDPPPSVLGWLSEVDPAEADLASYEASDRLNQTLADLTLQHYRQEQNAEKQPPLQALAQALAAIQPGYSDPDDETEFDAAEAGLLHQPGTSPGTVFAPPPVSLMTLPLKQQALQLQKELLQSLIK